MALLQTAGPRSFDETPYLIEIKALNSTMVILSLFFMQRGG
jgi:hypothetical protein